MATTNRTIAILATFMFAVMLVICLICLVALAMGTGSSTAYGVPTVAWLGALCAVAALVSTACIGACNATRRGWLAFPGLISTIASIVGALSLMVQHIYPWMHNLFHGQAVPLSTKVLWFDMGDPTMATIVAIVSIPIAAWLFVLSLQYWSGYGHLQR